jgi:lauroyl/myristoyl acyltransferase
MIPASLIDEAEKLADDLRLNSRALDFLYSRSRYRSMPRAEWERNIRISAALNQVMRRTKDGYDFKFFFDQEATQNALESLRSPDGLLLLTCHGGFSRARRGFYRFLSTQQFHLMRLGKKAIVEDQRQALFAALRTLQDGGAVQIAPDGPRGQQMSAPKILGKAWQVGEGAGFLASTSECATAWYSIVLDGQCFVPHVETGPQFKRGGSADEFSERLYQFYADRIEALLTGDPRNIVLGPRWARILIS